MVRSDKTRRALQGRQKNDMMAAHARKRACKCAKRGEKAGLEGATWGVDISTIYGMGAKKTPPHVVEKTLTSHPC